MTKETKRTLIEHLRELDSQDKIGWGIYVKCGRPHCTVGHAMHKLMTEKAWLLWTDSGPEMPSEQQAARYLGLSSEDLDVITSTNDEECPADAINLLAEFIPEDTP